MKSNNKHVPVYMMISSALREQILNGSLSPGQILPSENELCSIYNTSRETVRKGLIKLEQENLIYSLPRRGYFVSTPHHNKFTLSLPEYLFQSQNSFQDIKIINAEEELQKALQLSPGQKVIAIFCKNYINNKVFGAEIKYTPYQKGIPSIESEIDYAVFQEAANAKAPSFNYYTQLRISAVFPPEEITHLLQCDKKEPLLLLGRLHISQSGKPIGYSKQYLLPSYGELLGVSGYIKNK